MRLLGKLFEGFTGDTPLTWRTVLAIGLLGGATLFRLGAIHAQDEGAKIPVAKSAATSSHRLAINNNFRHDASLTDAFFIDSTSGWAVGDRGVIWHTADGGATWQQQSSGVTCSLSSVFFMNDQRGWAVGGECRPFSKSTQGVVLRTENAGRTWTQVAAPTLPRLRRVKFFDRQLGVAIGDVSPTIPSGVVATRDGGATWEPLPTDKAGSWLAGDFLDAQTGALAGPAGLTATLARHRVVHSPLATSSLRSTYAMRLLAPTGGWMAGDGGLILTTKDLGYSWQSPPADLPESADQFDFRALDVIDKCVWIAGSPGTHVFFSPDSGQTWSAFPTGHFTPLRALTFIDADHGWAVGDLGNILATDDGGRTWKSQRSGGQRAALLGIFAGATDVPLELLADAGAADGYIAAIDLLHTTAANDAESGAPISNDRSHETMLLAGAATTNSAWRFPLPADDPALSPADLLAALDRENDGRAVQQIERHIVQAVRMWRPEVIVTHHKNLERSQPRAAVLTALMLRSIEAAADPTRHAELSADGGLEPWQVKKVFGLLPANSHGVESMSRQRFSPWLGATLSDFVSPARALIAPTSESESATWEFEILLDQVATSSSGRGIFSGISLAPGSEARRPQPDLPVNDLADVQKSATRRRHLEALLERTESNAAWAAQIGNLIQDLRAEDGAKLLNQLADGYRQAGRLDLAADTSYMLARRYPDQPLADRAVTWLVHFYASSEMAHRLSSRQPNDIRQTAATDAPQPAPSAAVLTRDDRLRRAVQMSEYLQSARSALHADPAIRFAEVAAQRQLGFSAPAKRYYLTLGQLPESDPWRRSAETEEWLSQPAELPPPKTLGSCRRASLRPHLDAQLNEDFWDSADRLSLRDHDAPDSPGGEVRVTYDADHLYIAIRCPRAAGGAYESDDGPRDRDADLSKYDRVTLRFDIDRDFTTAYELSVDSRGWTHDACWGYPTWNPKWYVAAATNEEAWTVEAAIPMTELVSDPPTSRTVWAVSAVRTIPRLGAQSWSGAGNADSPEQYGLLIFE
jgi:photosystem II stability/assembly factor-like uncharacterized protein